MSEITDDSADEYYFVTQYVNKWTGKLMVASHYGKKAFRFRKSKAALEREKKKKEPTDIKQ